MSDRWSPLRLAVLAIFTLTAGARHEAVLAETGGGPMSHEISVVLNPDQRSIEVTDRFTRPASGKSVFTLAPWMTLVEARIDGRAVELERAKSQFQLPVATGDRHKVELVLKGVLPRLPEPEARGRVQDAVSDPEGSYLPGYAGWMAVFGDERIRYRLSLKVPKVYRAVAAGRLAEESVDEDSYHASFVADEPTELPAIFVGPYVIKELVKEGLRLRTYFHPELAALADDYLEISADYIRRYASQIGDYPYADFHIISAPLPVGLGFPNLTYVSRKIVPLPFMRGRSLAHEILHSWWGNGVAIDYDSGNWAEGLTAYQADYALAERQGPAASHEMRLGWLRNLTALPAERDIPVVGFVSKTHDASQAIGYDKIAFIFHMLRQEIGEDAFRAGLQAFWQAKRFEVAAWADLRLAFEQAAGRDLSWFFDQWLHRSGLPRVEVRDVKQQQIADTYRVTLTLRQQAPVYGLRIPLVIETSEGTQRTEASLSTMEETFTFPLEHSPLSVHVDPGFDVLRRLLPGESAPIIRDVTLAEDTVVVIATGDQDVAERARRLAGRLLQRSFTQIEGDRDNLPAVPMLVIGTTKEVEAFRSGHYGGQATTGLADQGTARAWAESGPDGRPWLFVQADNAKALEAVIRPLPHYRSRSFLVFEGSKASRKGVWPSSDSPLSVRFRAP